VPKSEKGITFVTLVAALAILVIIAAFIIGTLHRSERPPSRGVSETAAPVSNKPAAPRLPKKPATVASPERSDSPPKPAMPADCMEMLGKLQDKVEAWARTTTETDAIGNKGLCLDAKTYTVRVAEHCLSLCDTTNLEAWCESPTYVHPEVLLGRRARLRTCTDLADKRDALLGLWLRSAPSADGIKNRGACLEVKDLTEQFNRECAGVGGMRAQEIPAGWCESASFDPSSLRPIRARR